jgi:hypothetical protein
VGSPGVSLKFTSTQPPASVFIYYADRATELGWVGTGNTNVLGYPSVWTKTYPGGTRAVLSLTDLGFGPRTRRTPHTYILNGSA